MAKEWYAKDERIYRGDQMVGRGYGMEVASFLAAAAEHYRKFLGETSHIEDADIEPEHMSLFAPKDTRGCTWPNCTCDEQKCYYEKTQKSEG